MAARNNIFTTIRTEGALLPADLLQRISEGANLDGLTAERYHRPGEKLNEAINRSWNALQGAWASFRAAQERLSENDHGTRITRERWLLPLFRELDYGRLQTATAVEIDGRSYPISHRWEHVPLHLVGYNLELDRRTPGATGAASASPHSLLQVFLNRSENTLWGFLSNGYKLRILRDNVSLTRQAYVEFDLEAMMEGEVYSDFVLLWLLCHQSRVEGERPADCWLEKWMKVAEAQGTRALDQLRKGVEEAITALGLGFLEYHANATLRDKLTRGELSAQDYYRQLLRMVYRLLFLFVAEDRALLLNPKAPQDARERYSQYYSTQRLRRMAETFKGTRHPDLFESLRLVMRLLSGENNGAGAGLGLVPLGSFLFSDGAVTDIIDCQISNQHLLTAIRALSLTYDERAQVYRTVDYRNLGSDELGSIFESLLELHPQINVSARRFTLSTAAGNERKTTGSYYTPESLVHALLDSALNPVLEEAIRGTAGRAEAGRAKARPYGDSVGTAGMPSAEQRILNLKICDPACGSGHFLIAAANRMAKALAFVRTGEEEPPPAAIQEAKRDIISHCIYGVDINPMAVELCKVNLWMEALEPGKPLNFLDHRIQVGNSLLGTTPKLMADGIPDGAFSPIEGDDPKYVSDMKKANKQARKDRETRQHSIFELIDLPADYSHLTKAMHALDATPDDTLDAVRRKEAQYAALASDPEYIKARLLADAWCAAFVWEKRLPALDPNAPYPGVRLMEYLNLPLTDMTYRRLERNPLAENLQPMRESIVRLAQRYQFFHWHVAFPDVFSVGESPTQPPSPALPPHGEGSKERVREMATKAMRDIARDLRQRQTPAEIILWEALRKNRLNRLSFRRQHPIANTNYVADFFCYSENLIVELDGEIHQQQSKADAIRQGDLEQLGYKVLRFPNERIYTDLESVLAEILLTIQAKVPPPEGEGTKVPPPEGKGTAQGQAKVPPPEGEGTKVPPPEGEGFRVGAFNPQTGWYGGFDVVLGNPPWERIKIQEKEWFAERAPEIARAPNADARRRMIAELAERDPHLLQAFAADKRKAEGESHFVRVSERYPLCGRGDVNTYTIFAETARHIINGTGRVGIIVPSGIATDDTTKFFFQDLMQTRSLASFYDFENREGLFPAVDSRMKFALLTMTAPTPSPSPSGGEESAQSSEVLPHVGEGVRMGAHGAEFAFFLHRVSDLEDDWRRFTLSAQDIAMLNPNTGTMATFRSVRDAEITKAIYRRIPVLIRETAATPSPSRSGGGEQQAPSPKRGRFRRGDENPWGISFLRMFDMSNDSHLFRTREELEADGYVLWGNHFVRHPSPSLAPHGEGSQGAHDLKSPDLRGGDSEGKRYLPLYEAKMMHQFTHRWATYSQKPPSPALPPHGEGSQEAHDLKSPDLSGGDSEEKRALPPYEAKMMHQFTHRWATYSQKPPSPALPPHGEGSQEAHDLKSPHLRGGDSEGKRDLPPHEEGSQGAHDLKSPHLRGGDLEGGQGENLSTRDMTPAELRDPSALPLPRYWVDAGEVQVSNLIGYRRVARVTDGRSFISVLMPFVGVGDSIFLIITDKKLPHVLTANLNTFPFDYVARQKVGGTNISFFIVKQLPVIPPHTYTPALLDFIVPRVLELTYTAWDLQPFAQDVGYHGAPFVWDEKRRFLMRCELDALYFHLYQIPRDEVDYIMETFPIVRREDEAATADGRHPLALRASGIGGEGEYITKRIILEMYDQMAELPTMHVPAPKSPPRPEGEGDLGDEGEYITKRIILEMYDQMAELPTMDVPAPKSPPRPEGEGDLGDEGEYITERIILEMYDQMAELPTMDVPAPKSPPRPEGEGDLGGEGLYAVPDVRQWVTWLEPPPADPRMAHSDDRA
jgi:very-short-patch-repair endonuclease